MSRKCSRRLKRLADAAPTAGWRSLALRVLTTGDPAGKCAAALAASAQFASEGPIFGGEEIRPPAKPARPDRPRLLPPQAAPKRRLGTVEGRAALLHALAHIELNAVDLAFDMALRFEPEIGSAGLDRAAFIADWFRVGAEEARHFTMLDCRLRDLGSAYGALPAHGALWEAAEKTADGALARLAIAPLVLEARGLDVTPAMADRLDRAGDHASAAILGTIYADEIGHVATGLQWFERLCEVRGLEPVGQFEALVAARFPGGLKPPFNAAGRAEAGLVETYWRRWNGPCVESSAQGLGSR